MDGAIQIALQIIRFRGDKETRAQFRALVAPITKEFWNERVETLLVNGEKHPGTTFSRSQAFELVANTGAQPDARIGSWAIDTLRRSLDERVTLALLNSFERIPELPAGAVPAILDRAKMPDHPSIQGSR